MKPSIVNVEFLTSGRRDVKFGYTKFADFFDNDRQTFDQLSATFRQFKNWPNWIVSTSVIWSFKTCFNEPGWIIKTRLEGPDNTSRNNPIWPIFKLPKGGRKLVECLPIIIKKIGKFGIAEFYISPATCQKFDIND